MNLCHFRVPKSPILFLALILLASLPALSQRGTLGIDVGQTTDRFGSLSSASAVEGILNGKFTVLQGSGKQGDPSLVAGGEFRFPEDTSTHARELAGFVGPEFHFGNLMLGFHGQARKIYLPTSQVNGFTFVRNNQLFLELPAVAEYKFGQDRRAFVRAEGIWEFNPRYSNTNNGTSAFPNPHLDHGYSLRGTAGYNFPHWYLRASYESRYFKYGQHIGNPEGLDNWRSDLISGGIGFVF